MVVRNRKSEKKNDGVKQLFKRKKSRTRKVYCLARVPNQSRSRTKSSYQQIVQ